jgi:hypothetical protein
LPAVAYESSGNSARDTHYVPWIAGSLPLAYYVAGASAHGGVFEEGSLVAAARELGVAYPPGAPIQTLLGAALALLPVGPLSFRVSLASALCAALTLALFSRALLLTLSHIGISDARTAGLLSLAASWWLGQTPLFFAQALRPHVFASQFALSMLVIYTLLRFEAEEPHGTTRVLYFGAFVQGLCFANHHVYGLLMLPLAAPTLGRVFARRGFIGLMGHLAAPLIGFSAYLYVPLRLAHEPASGLADASGITRLLSVLSIEPYAGPSFLAATPLLPALAQGLGLEQTTLQLGLLALLALGGWVTLRSSHRRRFGTLWLLAALVPLGSALLSLRPRLLEDAWGVLLPSAAGVAALACAGAGALLDKCAGYSLRLAHGTGAGLVLLALLGFLKRDGAPQAALVELSDQVDDLTRRDLEPDALLFTDEAGSAFRLRGREAEERLRPDLELVPLALSAEERAVDAWVRRQPGLADSLRGWVLQGALDTRSLKELSADRPVYVEPGTRADPELYRTSLDEGLWLRVVSDGPLPAELRSERASETHGFGALERSAASARALEQSGLPQAVGRAQLFQALTRAALGDREGASDYLSLSRASGFVAPLQERLAHALSGPAKLDLGALLGPERGTP